MATPFTSIDLHEPPRLDAVRREQLRATSVALKTEGTLFAGALVLVVALFTLATVRFYTESGSVPGLEFGAPAAIPMALVGLLLPFSVWRGEDPARRDYHWAMPVPRETHTLTKVFAGWVWLMAAVAAYLLVLVLLGTLPPLLLGGPVRIFDGAAWQWAIPFTAASVGYLLTSVAVLATDHPWRWIGGILVGYPMLLLVLAMVGMEPAAEWIDQVRGGRFGLTSALFSNVYEFGPGRLTLAPERWLGATLVWGGLAMAGVVLAARRLRNG